MTRYTLEIRYLNTVYRQEYDFKDHDNHSKIYNVLYALWSKDYITRSIYELAHAFFNEVDGNADYAMIKPSNNFKLEMEKIDDNNDYTIDALLRR